MKILLMSDTHGNLVNAKKAIKKHKGEINCVIHCGDNIEDARILEENFPALDFIYVPGNCDPSYLEDKEKIIEFKGKKILVTHGHRFDVNSSYNRFYYYLESKKIDIGICGHTHKTYLGQDEKEEITIINPGSLTLPRDSDKPSYALLDIGKTGVENLEFFRVKQ